eukprot:EG_transcript_2623
MAPPMHHFPDELLLEICQYMGPLDLARCARLCHTFRRAAATDALWQLHCRNAFIGSRSPEESHAQVFSRVLPQMLLVNQNHSEKQKKNHLPNFLRGIFSTRKRHVYTNNILDCIPVYSSLLRALKNAKPPKGSTEPPYVVLHPGEYRETIKEGFPLVITKDCHLVAGSHDPPEVQVVVPVHFLRGTQVVTGVEFLCNVEANGGTTFENCVFRGGLELRAGTGHRVRGCVVRDSRGNGITVHKGAGALIDSCEIFENHNAGVDVQTALTDSVTITRCGIYGNANGIVVSTPCNCQIVHNRIHGNHAPGINLKAEGLAVIAKNQIYEGNWGIVLKEKGSGEVADNECFRNTHSAICIQTASSPRIVNNYIHHETRGVVVTGKYQTEGAATDVAVGRPTIEGNTFEANARSAISVKNGGNPIIIRNKIFGGRWGIVVQKRAGSLIQENDIYANSRPGIGIKTYANPEVERNRIHHGGAMGVMCSENGGGTLRDNEFFANSHSAITIKSGGNPYISSNSIHHERRGVAVSDRGAGVIENNEIFLFSKTGITIKSGGCPTVRHNRIHGGRQGLTVHEQGEGLVEGNIFFENTDLNLGLKKGGLTVIRNNRQGRLSKPALAALQRAALQSDELDTAASSTGWATEPMRERPAPTDRHPDGANPADHPGPPPKRPAREDRDADDSDSDESDDSDAEGDFAKCF